MSALQWIAVEDALQAWVVSGSGLASDHVTWAAQTAPRPVGEFISMRLTIIKPGGRDWYDRADNVVVVPLQSITAVSTGAGTLTIPSHGLVTGKGPLQIGGTPPAPLLISTNYWPVVIDANTIKVASTFQNAVAASPTTLTLTSVGSSPTIQGTATTTVPGQEVIQRLRGPRRGLLTLQCFAGAPTGGSPTGPTRPSAVLHDVISSYALESTAAALAAAGVGIASIDAVEALDGVVNTVRFEPRAVTAVHLHLASELVETSTYVQVVNATNNIPTVPIVLPSIVLP